MAGMPECPRPRTMRRSVLTVRSRPAVSPARRRLGADAEPSHGKRYCCLAALLAHSWAVKRLVRYTVPRATACAFCQTSLMIGRSLLCSYFEVIISIVTGKEQDFAVTSFSVNAEFNLPKTPMNFVPVHRAGVCAGRDGDQVGAKYESRWDGQRITVIEWYGCPIFCENPYFLIDRRFLFWYTLF